jgi:Peptidase family M28
VLLKEWVREFYRYFDVPQAMSDTAAITRHDRYQASAGIRSAAEVVAELAVAAGLSDVEVLQFAADGAERWWTFQAPAAWTPRRAEVLLVDASGTATDRLICYPDQPYSLAANSAATAADGITAPLVSWAERLGRDSLAGAVVLLDGQGPPAGHVLDTLSGCGARGVICVSQTAGSAGGAHRVGRVELPASSQLFAFSVTPMQLCHLHRWARAGGQVRVRVDTLTTGTMPVVTARFAGAADDEVLLTAHLCHAMPGANDNASGVAALLGVGRTLTRMGYGRPARTLRFLWGPEFVGLAAYLYEIVGEGRAPTPFAAVNLDMVGEDQRICGGPLIVERSPDHWPSWLNAVVEECVRTLPQASQSYSGAVPCDTWTWRSTPFAGASDHSLLADRNVGFPSVQLGHWPDRFNHSSDDTLDKVDPHELRRVVCAAGAAAAAACHAGPEDPGEL